MPNTVKSVTKKEGLNAMDLEHFLADVKRFSADGQLPVTSVVKANTSVGGKLREVWMEVD